jgi:cbb3-type cytochrome oxidase maturation protein
MNILLFLGPFSVFLGLMAVGAFIWTLRASQYDDIQGAAERILIDDDDHPGPPETRDAPDR